MKRTSVLNEWSELMKNIVNIRWNVNMAEVISLHSQEVGLVVVKIKIIKAVIVQ